MTESRNYLLCDGSLTANGTLLTFGKTVLGTSGLLCFKSFFGMTKRRNYFLLQSGQTTNRTYKSIGNTVCYAGSRGTGNNRFGMFVSTTVHYYKVIGSISYREICIGRTTVGTDDTGSPTVDLNRIFAIRVVDQIKSKADQRAGIIQCRNRIGLEHCIEGITDRDLDQAAIGITYGNQTSKRIADNVSDGRYDIGVIVHFKRAGFETGVFSNRKIYPKIGVSGGIRLRFKHQGSVIGCIRRNGKGKTKY